jgi:hypothetical protein
MSVPLRVEIDRGPWRKTLSFPTVQDLKDFLDFEDRMWAWTRTDFSAPFRDQVASYGTWTNDMRTSVAAFESAPTEENLELIRVMLQRRFQERLFLAAIDAPAGALAAIAETDLRTAAIATMTAEGRALPAEKLGGRDPIWRVGQAMGLSILAGVSPTLSEAAQESMKETDRQLATRLSEFGTSLETFRTVGTEKIAGIAAEGATAIAEAAITLRS